MIQQAGTASSQPSPAAPPVAPARTKLLLTGPILPTLLKLAAPNVLNLLAFVGVIVFDGYFLGRIGTNALAGAFVMLVLQTNVSSVYPFPPSALPPLVKETLARVGNVNETRPRPPEPS